jgi:hypothetical protein
MKNQNSIIQIKKKKLPAVADYVFICFLNSLFFICHFDFLSFIFDFAYETDCTI